MFLPRLKKEKRSFIVRKGLEERRKLDDMHKKKMDELVKNHEEVRKALRREISAVSKVKYCTLRTIVLTAVSLFCRSKTRLFHNFLFPGQYGRPPRTLLSAHIHKATTTYRPTTNYIVLVLPTTYIEY